VLIFKEVSVGKGDMPEYIDLLVLAAFLVIVALVLIGLRRLMRGVPQESARDQWLRWRACTRKRAYSTKKEAQVVVGRHAMQGDVVEAYQCRWCKRWHVGHPSPFHRE
jgi:hypothetical protein